MEADRINCLKGIFYGLGRYLGSGDGVDLPDAGYHSFREGETQYEKIRKILDSADQVFNGPARLTSTSRHKEFEVFQSFEGILNDGSIKCRHDYAFLFATLFRFCTNLFEVFKNYPEFISTKVPLPNEETREAYAKEMSEKADKYRRLAYFFLKKLSPQDLSRDFFNRDISGLYSFFIIDNGFYCLMAFLNNVGNISAEEALDAYRCAISVETNPEYKMKLHQEAGDVCFSQAMGSWRGSLFEDAKNLFEDAKSCYQRAIGFASDDQNRGFSLCKINEIEKAEAEFLISRSGSQLQRRNDVGEKKEGEKKESKESKEAKERKTNTDVDDADIDAEEENSAGRRYKKVKMGEGNPEAEAAAVPMVGSAPPAAMNSGSFYMQSFSSPYAASSSSGARSFRAWPPAMSGSSSGLGLSGLNPGSSGAVAAAPPPPAAYPAAYCSSTLTFWSAPASSGASASSLSAAMPAAFESQPAALATASSASAAAASQQAQAVSMDSSGMASIAATSMSLASLAPAQAQVSEEGAQENPSAGADSDNEEGRGDENDSDHESETKPCIEQSRTSSI